MRCVVEQQETDAQRVLMAIAAHKLFDGFALGLAVVMPRLSQRMSHSNPDARWPTRRCVHSRRAAVRADVADRHCPRAVLRGEARADR
jgi:hypothetical protein